jgi:hypothetical protein
MLCLHDSVRHTDSAGQRLLSAVADTYSLPELILAAWQVVRVLTVHLVEAVLAERARHPTLWPRCPQCGACFRSKGWRSYRPPAEWVSGADRRRRGRGVTTGARSGLDSRRASPTVCGVGWSGGDMEACVSVVSAGLPGA